MNTFLSGTILAFGCGYMLYSYFYKNSLKYLISKYEQDNNCKLIIIKQNRGSNIDDKLATNLANMFNKLSNNKNVDIILHTNGGDLFASIRIYKLFQMFPNKIRIFVPTHAYSAGTLLSLMVPEIYANNYSQFSP